MPILSEKRRISLRPLFDIRGLSNKAEHIGKRITLTRSEYLGYKGKIVGAVMAANRADPPELYGGRGVFYTIELADRILEGVTWTEFLRVANGGS